MSFQFHRTAVFGLAFVAATVMAACKDDQPTEITTPNVVSADVVIPVTATTAKVLAAQTVRFRAGGELFGGAVGDSVTMVVDAAGANVTITVGSTQFTSPIVFGSCSFALPSGNNATFPTCIVRLPTISKVAGREYAVRPSFVLDPGVRTGGGGPLEGIGSVDLGVGISNSGEVVVTGSNFTGPVVTRVAVVKGSGVN